MEEKQRAIRAQTKIADGLSKAANKAKTNAEKLALEKMLAACQELIARLERE